MGLKNLIYVKNIMFGILLHLVVKIKNIWQVLWIIQQLYVMLITYNLYNLEPYNKEIKTVPTNFSEKKQPEKREISIFYLHFY